LADLLVASWRVADPDGSSQWFVPVWSQKIQGRRAQSGKERGMTSSNTSSTIAYDPVQLYDKGFGPRLVSVTPPECEISPSSSLQAKHRGKAPGRLTQAGWTSLDLNNPKFRCHDYNTAKLWRDQWGANTGFVTGDGFIVIDNDQGETFSEVLQTLLSNPLRRYVLDPKHGRDSFFLRVLDFVGDGVNVGNRELKFKQGMLRATVQILAQGKQSVIAGIHPGTRAPYAWSRELTSLDDIPIISVEQFDAFLMDFIRAVADKGWILDGPVSVTSSVSAVPAPAGAASQRLSPQEIQAKISAARALLAEIPNRDLAPGETPGPVDDWLDSYANWTSVAYALAAFLGAAATSPEAQALWLEWSDGRTQQTQTSLSVWHSVLGQSLKFGEIGLIKLVRGFVPPKTDFPDIAPDDPMIQPPKTPIWDALKARWAYCRAQGFIDTLTGDVVSRQGFSDDNAHLAKALARELRPKHRGKPPSVADLFLAQADKRRVRNVTYAPGDPMFIGPNDPNLPVFNFWRPSTYGGPMPSAAQIKPWLDHVELVMGSPYERDLFIRWCAFVAQNPKLKPNWCFLIMSLQGLGKDTMVAPIKLAVGDNNWREELIYSLADNFTEAIEHKLLIVGETAQPRQGVVSAHDLGTRLKPLLSQPPTELKINKKFQTPYTIPNRLAVILFSNEANPLHLERGQRRVHVVNRLGVKAALSDYYWSMHEWLNAGGAEMVASYLLSYPLTEAERREFIGGNAPETDAKIELEHQNTPPALAALEDIIRDARAGIVNDTTPNALVATAEELVALIKGRGLHGPTPQNIRTWLLDMEKQNTGVRRLRIDHKEPHLCGVVGNGKVSARLWLLGDTAPDGTPWNTMNYVEIIAVWKNFPRPSKGTVHQFPSGEVVEEPV
jgi:Family of unknown function (DUF5906)/Bifunctional DNA primase/polymerase, N-terminal